MSRRVFPTTSLPIACRGLATRTDRSQAYAPPRNGLFVCVVCVVCVVYVVVCCNTYQSMIGASVLRTFPMHPKGRSAAIVYTPPPLLFFFVFHTPNPLF
eukprot:NODE_5904_length_382_cov_20.021021_g5191_i0.p1 GENE.NODE_5904_length_382_cov_20.021021_g5191_i0~~NODE_5904_length_382_cov_20.021021_g5191_i0.p1  ORF type:complete len:99 (+),score=5.64 NODE_5904_length_382_cov_20.021021_g5191_i0:69-365(+)